MYFSFIFPVCNEQEYLEKQLNFFCKGLKDYKIKCKEILLVENGSNDGTWKIINNLEKNNKLIKGLRIKGASYGRATKHGLLSARADYVFLLNVDFFDFNFIRKAIENLDKYDVVVGSKILSESSDERSFLRKLRTKMLYLTMRYIFKYPGSDTHGIKVFRNNKNFKKIITDCFCKYDLFDTELLWRLTKLNYKLLELPVKVEEIRKSRYKIYWFFDKPLKDLYRIVIFSLLKNKKVRPSVVIADDYGLSPLINSAILDQVRGKAIDGVAVMPNLVKKKDLYRGIKYSMHVNLTRGKPVTDKKFIPTLVSKKGFFYMTPVLLIKFLFRQVKKEEIKIEIENQIKKLNSYGIKVQSLNSEQHIHLFSPVRTVVYELMDKYKIKNIRSEWSTQNYLITKPERFLIYLFFRSILAVVYLDFLPNTKQKDVTIVHPGANFD